MRLAFLLVCTLGLGAIVPTALAQQARITVTRRQPSRPSPADYLAKVREGMEAAVAGNTADAIAKLQEAIALDGSRPEAHYYLGEVQRITGDLAAAAESFRTADQRAVQVGDDRMRARALQGVAETLERTPDQREQARLAWNEAAAFGDAHREVSSPDLARGRMQVIDALVQNERDYVAVRERIAARAAQATPAPTPAANP